ASSRRVDVGVVQSLDAGDLAPRQRVNRSSVDHYVEALTLQGVDRVLCVDPGGCRRSGAGKSQCGGCESPENSHRNGECVPHRNLSSGSLIGPFRRELSMRVTVGQLTDSSVGSGSISRDGFGVGRGRRGSRTPAPPPRSSHSRTPDPLLTSVPARGLWSLTTQACGADGVACGTACTATSPTWFKVCRASSQVYPITSGTATTASPGAGSSTSRQRSQADWRVTPSWTAISDQDLRCRRAIPTAFRSTLSNPPRTVPMSDNAISAPSPSPRTSTLP